MPFFLSRDPALTWINLNSVSKEEKDQYVESIIELLELQDFAEAVVLTLSVEGMKAVLLNFMSWRILISATFSPQTSDNRSGTCVSSKGTPLP